MRWWRTCWPGPSAGPACWRWPGALRRRGWWDASPWRWCHISNWSGLAALAVEWWVGAEAAQEDPAVLLACCDLLADWCRAHGVRHMLLAPALLAGSQADSAGFVAHAGACGIAISRRRPRPWADRCRA
ncbi:hypothetical protein ACU4HD_21305 [Cupriavidus basilensis]